MGGAWRTRNAHTKEWYNRSIADVFAGLVELCSLVLDEGRGWTWLIIDGAIVSEWTVRLARENWRQFKEMPIIFTVTVRMGSYPGTEVLRPRHYMGDASG